VSGEDEDFRASVRAAEHALESGNGYEALQRLREASTRSVAGTKN
jgi:hypothetical protein